jgi:uncharacterized membrane protein YbaN (DUF454 family)
MNGEQFILQQLEQKLIPLALPILMVVFEQHQKLPYQLLTVSCFDKSSLVFHDQLVSGLVTRYIVVKSGIYLQS